MQNIRSSFESKVIWLKFLIELDDYSSNSRGLLQAFNKSVQLRYYHRVYILKWWINSNVNKINKVNTVSFTLNKVHIDVARFSKDRLSSLIHSKAFFIKVTREESWKFWLPITERNGHKFDGCQLKFKNKIYILANQQHRRFCKGIGTWQFTRDNNGKIKRYQRVILIVYLQRIDWLIIQW